MSAALRGLSQGLQTGLQMGSVLRDVSRRRALQEEAARYGVTEGAYGPELLQNIEQLEGLKAQDPAQAAAYDQAIGELQRRSQMTAPDFSVASGAQNFGTREEATRAARPMRAEGLASVYERFGDIERAEELRERADAGRLRDLQYRQTELGLKSLERSEAEAEGLQMAQQIIVGAQQAGQTVDSDFLRVVAQQTGANFNTLIDTEAKRLGFEDMTGTAAIKKLQRDLSAASAKGIDGLNAFLAENFDPDQSDDITPKVVRDRQGNYVVQYGDRVLSEYGAHKSLDFLVGTVQGRINGDPLGTLKTLADIRQSDARTGLVTEQRRALRNTEEVAAERARIIGEFDSLSPEEQAGPKGQALMRQFNMANVRIGGTVPLGGAARAEKPLTPEQENAWKLAQKDDRFTRAANANDRPAMRAYLTARGIPLSVLPGLDEGPPGGGTMTPDAPAAPAAATDVASEAGIDTSRAPATRGQARQDARVRAELSREFEARPEVQAMLRDLEESRAGLRRGGRTDTRELAAQIAQMREQYIAERMGAR